MRRRTWLKRAAVESLEAHPGSRGRGDLPDWCIGFCKKRVPATLDEFGWSWLIAETTWGQCVGEVVKLRQGSSSVMTDGFEST